MRVGDVVKYNNEGRLTFFFRSFENIVDRRIFAFGNERADPLSVRGIGRNLVPVDFHDGNTRRDRLRDHKPDAALAFAALNKNLVNGLAGADKLPYRISAAYCVRNRIIVVVLSVHIRKS